MGLHRSASRDVFDRREERFYEGFMWSPVDMLENLIDRKWFFLAIVAGCIALSLAYIVMSSPVYHAEALIKLDERNANPIGSLSDVSRALDVQKSPVASELDIVRSRSVMLQAMDATVAQAVVSVKHPVPLVGGFLSTILPREPNGLVNALFDKLNWAWGGEHVVFKSYEVPDNQLGKTLRLEFIGDGKWRLRNTEGRELLSGSVGTLAHANGFKVDVSEIVAHPDTEFTVTREPTEMRLEQIQKDFSAAERKRQSGVMQLSYENVDPVFAARLVDAMAAAYLASNNKLRAADSERSLESALVPVRPMKPKRTIVLLLGAVFGVVLGFVGTQLIPLLSRRVRDPKRLETIVGVQTLGVLPISPHQIEAGNAKLSRCILSHEQSDTPFVKALDTLAHSLQHKLESKERSKVVLVTSVVRGQGKSMLPANLAYQYANRGLKTLVIDADMCRSSLQRYLPLSRDTGLLDVLQGKADVAKAISQPFENLHAILAGKHVSQVRNLLDFERLDALIESLRDRYDMIVISSPPVLPMTEAAALSKVADATILVVRQGLVRYSEVRKSVSRLHKLGTDVDGLVFNGFEPSPLRYGFHTDTHQYLGTRTAKLGDAV